MSTRDAAAGMGSGLVVGEAQPESLKRLQLRFVKHLGRLLFGLPVAAASEGFRSHAMVVRRRFEELSSRDRRLAFRMLLRPHVHVHLWCAVFALEQGRGGAAAEHSDALWRQLAFEMAHEPSIGGLLAPSGSDGRGCASPVLGLPREAFKPICPGLALALVDTNPLAMNEAHPDKEGNALSLGDASAADWVTGLQAALGEVERWLPAIRQEMRAVLHQFVPVGTDEHKHLSASFAEAVGTVYLSLHPSSMTMTEAIIHEYQHNKLHMLLALDPVLHNAYYPLYSSPVRPDKRPLAGVLLAAHAFVPVAELYARMASGNAANPDAMHRFEAVVNSNSAALATLCEHAQPTPAGSAVLADLVAFNERHRAALNMSPVL